MFETRKDTIDYLNNQIVNSQKTNKTTLIHKTILRNPVDRRKYPMEEHSNKKITI
jgi:hypothetical protein